MVKIFENDRLVALDKPPGVSMATSSRDPVSAERAIGRLLEASGEPYDSDLLLVHRLDVGTSGVVLLARGPEAHRELSRAFQSGSVRKTYRALVWGHPRPAEATIEEPLARNPRDGRKMRVAATGKRSVTRYSTLTRLPSVADLAISPRTGRTHQIRVHLAARGHPIVGDDLYGGAGRWRGVRNTIARRSLASVVRPLLHAQRLEIPEMGIDVAAPLPPDYAGILEKLSRPSPEADR